MAKALKTAALIATGVALAFTGVGLAAGLGAYATSFGIGLSASTLLLGAAGLSVASALLQKNPSVTSSQADRLSATIDPRAHRKDVVGGCAMACDVDFR